METPPLLDPSDPGFGDPEYQQHLRPRRREGQLELTCWDATDDELALGLASAREVFAARGFAPGYAAISSMAVDAFERDGTLPEPDTRTRAAAAAYREACDIAYRTVGATDAKQPEFDIHQTREDRLLWNELPTLREQRVRHNSPYLADPLRGFREE